MWGMAVRCAIGLTSLPLSASGSRPCSLREIQEPGPYCPNLLVLSVSDSSSVMVVETERF